MIYKAIIILFFTMSSSAAYARGGKDKQPALKSNKPLSEHHVSRGSRKKRPTPVLESTKLLLVSKNSRRSRKVQSQHEAIKILPETNKLVSTK